MKLENSWRGFQEEMKTEIIKAFEALFDPILSNCNIFTQSIMQGHREHILLGGKKS